MVSRDGRWEEIEALVEYLFISNVLGAEADGSLHANKRKNLDEVILHDVTDDAVAIEVASASLCTNVLLLGRTKSKNAR
jgi:hypothetical protein